jgi:uracil-DNA glycosylase
VFTGDRSGDWLFAALHRVGLAVRATSEHAGDGQRLVSTRMVAAVRCAPPANAPTPAERDTCSPWLDAELVFVLPSVRAVVCLGSVGWDAAWRALGRQGVEVPRPRPRFGHGVRVPVDRPAAGVGRKRGRQVVVLGCYHPSQQNTFTGKLSEQMLDDVLGAAAALGRG